ncbi:MAG: PAS domain S-box protein [Thermodesulfobacteriota bacterium]|nr:MAG: PAS domain S-box protein [Thermodesulfobacteriota bacterium]
MKDGKDIKEAPGKPEAKRWPGGADIELLSAIFDSAMDGIFVIGMDGRYREVNPAGCMMFGYSREELMISDTSLLLFPEDAPRAFEEIRSSDGVFHPSYRMRRKDGSEVWVGMTVKTVQAGGEKLKLAVKRDVTERKKYLDGIRTSKEQLEEKVRRRTAELKSVNRSLEMQISKRVRTEELLHTILKATSSVTGEEFLRTLVRHLAVALEFKYALVAEHVGGMKARTLAFWAKGRFADNFEYALEGTPCENVARGELCAYPSRVQEAFPRDRYLVQMEAESYVGVPLVGSDGRALGLLVAIDDKPLVVEHDARALMRLFALRAALELERKRSEDERKKSIEMLNIISDHSGAAILIKDSEGRHIFVNKSFEDLFKRKKEEILGLRDRDLFPALTAAGFRANDIKALEAGRPVEFEEEVLNPDGRLLTFLSVKFPVPGLPGAICAISTDITERKKIEEALRRSEERLREAQAIAHIGNWDWDIPNNRLHWSDEIFRIFGLDAAEFEATYDAFLSLVHPDDRDEVQIAVKEALEHGKPYDVRHRVLRPDGTERIVTERAEVVRDPEGKPVRMYGTVQDVTEHKRLEAEMLRAQKLDSIGVLAGGIAHDFNNLLLGILGNVSIAKNLVKPADRVAGVLDEIEKAALRTKSLTRQLLTFSRGGEPVREPASIEQIVRDSAPLVLRGSEVVCEYSFPDGLWPVEVDQGQMAQAVSNIVLNALQAMPDGGRLRVSASNIEVDEQAHLPLKPGKYIKTTFRDYGTGIPVKLLPKLFDPFFTTRKKASGLGLSVTYSIIKKHSGHIGVDSEIGEGSSFHVYLPASAGKPVDAASDDTVVKGAGRVLVMDDEELIRDVSGEMLKLLGYEAVFAVSGGEAIELFMKARDEGRPFDAVILDLTVPGGLGGMETMQKLKEIDPGVRAIVSSGYSKDPIMADYRKFGFSAVMAKPYRVAEFSKVVKKVVGDGGNEQGGKG